MGSQLRIILTEENRITQRKFCPSATFSTMNSKCIDPGENPVLYGERTAINHVSNDNLSLSSVMCICPSVFLHVTTVIRLNGISLNSILRFFIEIFLYIRALVKSKCNVREFLQIINCNSLCDGTYS